MVYIIIYVYYDDVIFQRSRLVFILVYSYVHMHGRFGIYKLAWEQVGIYVLNKNTLGAVA